MPPNVIFLVIDTVRSDRVSGYGYDRQTTPNFDSFAEDVTVFSDAVSQAAWSIPAHGSLFTGKYPSEHRATTIGPILQDADTFPRLLSDAGYETYGISPNEYVRPLTGFGHGFDEFYPCRPVTVPPAVADGLAPVANWGAATPRLRYPIERVFNHSRTSAPRSVEPNPPESYHLVPRVTDILTRAAEPYLLFVNIIDAHLPRSPKPEHVDRFVDDELRDEEVVENERAHTFGDDMGPDAIRKMSQLYDADLRTMDDKLGEVLDALQHVGALDDSLVVLVSDHGEHLGEFGMIGHQQSLFEEVVSVPLAIRFPDGGPAMVDQQVELRRLFHTVLDEAAVEAYPERSLASGAGDDVARGEFFTPMLDIGQLYEDRTIAFDARLMGETLSFNRDGDSKTVQFDGRRWEFDLPESASGAIRAGEKT